VYTNVPQLKIMIDPKESLKLWHISTTHL